MAFGLCSAQQWTLGGRRKKIEQLLPTQSCYYEQVCVCVDIPIFFLYVVHFSSSQEQDLLMVMVTP